MADDRRAYTLGRILAALDHLGVVHEVERLYELTCQHPHNLAGPLNQATTASETNRDYLTPLVATLPEHGAWSGPLTDEDVSAFALGYYHQRADSRAGRAPTFDDDMTVAQAADLLDITRQTVHQAIDAGRLPARRVGERSTLIRRADVEAYAASRKPRPPRPDPESTVQ